MSPNFMDKIIETEQQYWYQLSLSVDEKRSHACMRAQMSDDILTR